MGRTEKIEYGLTIIGGIAVAGIAAFIFLPKHRLLTGILTAGGIAGVFVLNPKPSESPYRAVDNPYRPSLRVQQEEYSTRNFGSNV